MHTVARPIGLGAFAALTLLLASASGGPTAPDSVAAAPAADAKRTVYVLRGLGDRDRIVVSAAVAAAGDAVVLLDSPKLTRYTKAFLAAYHPDRVVVLADSSDGLAEVEERMGMNATTVVVRSRGPPVAPWSSLSSSRETVVVCPAEPRSALLQAACLAGVSGGPLVVLPGADGEEGAVRGLLDEGKVRQVYLVGAAGKLGVEASGRRVTLLDDEAAVADAYLRRLGDTGKVETLVVANAADAGGAGMSSLAPLVALRKRAALVLTNPAGTDVAERVAAATARGPLRGVESVILVGDLKALPTEQRPNPIHGDKDAAIEMEPLTPTGATPFSFAVGRLFHDDPAVPLLMLSRERLLAESHGPRKALVASNSGGGLPLLEAFSRNTAREFTNAGYETTAVFGKDVNPIDLRAAMMDSDVFLWEGHHNTLIKDWAFPTWDEPTPPSLAFLQSCLALQDYKAEPLLARGAVGVVGASTRTYSGAGGACSLAFFDALLYDRLSVGGSLRQAKNFLLCYALLKEKLLGREAPRSGASLRSAWAFTLWGDPTLRLPAPAAPTDALPPVRCDVDGDQVTLRAPERNYAKITSGKYQVETPPNARLAGLIRREAEDEPASLTPFWFAEVHLTGGRPGQSPVLHGKMPANHWVFAWDGRRECGYLLLAPRATDGKQVRFRVEWRDDETAAAER
jgi:hypothetical protein